MNCSNYINWFLKSHGWDVALDEPDSTLTTITNSRTWDQWIDTTKNIDRDNDNDNADVTDAAVASITNPGRFFLLTLCLLYLIYSMIR